MPDRKVRHLLFSLKYFTAEEQPLELTEAVSQLKPEWRLVIVLHYMEGCTVQEISAMTGMPTGTVKARLSAARRRLGRLLNDEWEEEKG